MWYHIDSAMQIYNSLVRKKEEFRPLDGMNVRIYACGPTVYDLSHLGHARVFIIWDIIQRYLRFKGYNVTFVRNVTDIDDKIINKAKDEGRQPEQIARKYLFEFWKDMEALNVQQPDIEPRATEFLAQMIEFVQRLIAKGRAYQSGSDVYFDVKSSANYGQLTKQDLDSMLVGSRDQVLSQEQLEERKKHPADFALWKGVDSSQCGWQSPWGFGRPGWHLECSTMIKNVLGETIDIHGGGEDLLFPHHENEIAQSEGLHDKPLARYWMHNSFVQVNAEKMSKSLGNFNTIRDLMHSYSADELRLFILQTHYRNPIDFSPEGLQAAKTAMQRLIRAMCFEPGTADNGVLPGELTASARANPPALSDPQTKDFHKEFTEAMDNDFNTAVAIASLFGLSDAIIKSKDAAERHRLKDVLVFYAKLLGFTLADTRQSLKSTASHQLMDLILSLRADSKQRKDYATSDLIRKRLSDCGINVMDTASGATWETNS
jgi:cysteinyl-tRNA synthetase